MDFLSIHPATAADLDALQECFRELDNYHAVLLPGEFQPYEGPPRDPVFLQGVMDNPERALLVASGHVGIIGFVQLQRGHTPDLPMFQPREFTTISDLFVSAAHRGKGVGRALLDAAHAWSRERGIGTVQLDVYCDNEGAREFYRELGYREQRVQLRLELDP